MKKSILWVGGIILLGIIVALILIFKKPTYEVSFISDGAEILESVKIKEDKTIEEPEIPEKDGYIFEGWYSDSEKFDFSTKITEDITLEAKWVKENAKIYTLTFNSNGGSNVSSIKVEEDATVSNLPIPKKDGFKFIGWYDGKILVDSDTKITKDMTLVAKWEETEDEITTVKTTKKKTTKKKTTTKVTTTKEATTKATTTAAKKDEIAYDWVPLKDDTVGQETLYLLKNGERVAGTCDITYNSGKTVTKEVPVTGFVTTRSIVNKITNIKVN